MMTVAARRGSRPQRELCNKAARAYNPLWNHYCCADGKWIAFAMLQADRYWPDVARIIGRPEIAEDPRFADMAARAGNAEECVAILDDAFSKRSREDWLKCLREDESDLIYTLVNSVDDLPEDPQVLANDYIVELDHPQHGPTPMVGIPVGLSETPGSVRLPAPELGQHTEDVLQNVLGWDWDRISALRDREVI